MPTRVPCAARRLFALALLAAPAVAQMGRRNTGGDPRAGGQADVDMAMAGWEQLSQNPDKMAEVMASLQDPEVAAKAQEMLKDPEYMRAAKAKVAELAGHAQLMALADAASEFLRTHNEPPKPQGPSFHEQMVQRQRQQRQASGEDELGEEGLAERGVEEASDAPRLAEVEAELEQQARAGHPPHRDRNPNRNPNPKPVTWAANSFKTFWLQSFSMVQARTQTRSIEVGTKE